MIGDYGRETSVNGRAEDYESLRFFSGRMIHAADLNEESDLQTLKREAALRDVIGRVGVPKDGGGFQVNAEASGGFTLSAGDIYVEGARFTTGQTLYPANLASLAPANATWLVLAEFDKNVVDMRSDPILRDPGLFGPDTSGRLRPHFRIFAHPLASFAFANGTSDADFLRLCKDGRSIAVPGVLPRSGGARFEIDPAHVPSDDDCLIQEQAQYSGLGNFNYRIEIHRAGGAGQGSYKWAREDVRATIVAEGSKRVLQGAPTDDHRRIRSGDTVEVKGHMETLANLPGTLGTITIAADGAVSFSAEIQSVLANLPPPVTITRWDHPHLGHENGILIATSPMMIEKGIRISLQGSHLAGDYWFCAARVNTGSILWPPLKTDDDASFVPPFNWGPHIVALASFKRSGNQITDVQDLRPRFPSLTHLTADDVTVRDHADCAFPGETVQEALDWLCVSVRANICSITVRPDIMSATQQSLRPDIYNLPTLAQALQRVDGVLQKWPYRTNSEGEVPFFRRLAITFTAGEYSWPDTYLALMKDLTSVALMPCPAAPVTIKASGWLDLNRCMKVNISGINWAFSGLNAGLAITHGKEIILSKLQIRRAHSVANAPLILAAKRRVELDDVRVLLDNVNPAPNPRPAIHLLDASAQTSLNAVASNGELIIGPSVPASTAATVQLLLDAARYGRFSGNFEPVMPQGGAIAPNQSSATLQVTACKLLAILPDEGMMLALQAWATSKRLSGGVGTGIAIDHNAAERMVTEPASRTARVAQPVTGGGAIAAQPIRPSREVAEKIRMILAPFRHITIADSELIRGPSLLVAETVTIRNSKFPQYGEAECEAGGQLIEIARSNSLPASQLELAHLVFGPGNNSKRKWRPVAFAISARTSFDTNLGYPEYGSQRVIGKPDEEPWPILLDYAPRNPYISAKGELNATAYAMVHQKLLFLHSSYLRD